jgi:hypothetical protein
VTPYRRNYTPAPLGEPAPAQESFLLLPMPWSAPDAEPLAYTADPSIRGLLAGSRTSGRMMGVYEDRPAKSPWKPADASLEQRERYMALTGERMSVNAPAAFCGVQPNDYGSMPETARDLRELGIMGGFSEGSPGTAPAMPVELLDPL